MKSGATESLVAYIYGGVDQAYSYLIIVRREQQEGDRNLVIDEDPVGSTAGFLLIPKACKETVSTWCCIQWDAMESLVANIW